MQKKLAASDGGGFFFRTEVFLREDIVVFFRLVVRFIPEQKLIFAPHVYYIYLAFAYIYVLYGPRTFHPFCGSPPDGSPLYNFFFIPTGASRPGWFTPPTVSCQDVSPPGKFTPRNVHPLEFSPPILRRKQKFKGNIFFSMLEILEKPGRVYC